MTATMSAPLIAMLVVPNGTHRPEPVANALRALHPDWGVGAVWCGDPQLRPQIESTPWLDEEALDRVTDVDLVRGHRSVGEWKRALATTKALLADGAEHVVLLWVGAVAVLEPIGAVVGSGPMTVVPRAESMIPDDGRVPAERDLMNEGAYSTTVAHFAATAQPAIEWMSANLTGTIGVGRVLERVVQLFGATVCADPSIGVGRWRWSSPAPALLDVDGFDTRRPWTLDAGSDGVARIELVGHADRRTALDRAAPQLIGEVIPPSLPGGIQIDDRMRRVVAAADGEVPSPWAAPAQFRGWLAERYWRVVHDERADLATAFPDPDGRSAGEFRRWCRAAFTTDDVPMLMAPPRLERQPLRLADSLRSDGLNLVGYFTRDSGLGDVVRRLRDASISAGVAHSTIATQRSASPRRDGESADNAMQFTNSVCVVTADQFPYLAADIPELFERTQRMVGYWFWELDYVPLPMRQSFALVDEVWAGSRFVTDAFAAVSPVPVRHVPIPVVEPRPSSRRRQDFAAIAEVGERPLFVCTLDHLSVTERKNPLGAIEAFRRAFAPGEGPVLLVKTMNAKLRWSMHQPLLAAADGRDDIRVWDAVLGRADQMALIAAADCMVSLHRSEGLGLHLAEAMWLDTPAIATRYSGNLDFMNDDNSLLIDADLVNVENGESVYPVVAKWAAPDLDQAATAMQRVVGDAALRQRLAAAGRSTMERQPTLADTGKLIRRLVVGEG